MKPLKPKATKQDIIKAINELIEIMDIKPVDCIGFEIEPSEYYEEDDECTTHSN